MNGLTNEQWSRIWDGIAEKAPEVFADCDLGFSISVREPDGSEKTIYQHEVNKNDSNTDN